MKIHLINSSFVGDTVHGTSISAPCFAFKCDIVMLFGGGS
jgi:hypothetical protein